MAILKMKWLHLALAAGLLVGFCLYVGSTVRRVSPTIDEPLHVSGAWHTRFAADHRIDREDPALWRWWVSLFVRRDDVSKQYPPGPWSESPTHSWARNEYLTETMYKTSRPAGVLYRARWSAVGVGVMLVASVMWMAWRARGPWAGLGTGLAASLDPLLLGHSVVVKNDWPVALVFVWGCWFAWMRWEGRWRWLPMAGVVVCTAALPLVKFSGIALGPIVLAVWMAREWIGMKARSEEKPVPWIRMLAVALGTPALFFLLVWAGYHFRPAMVPGGEEYATRDRQASLAMVVNSGSESQKIPKDQYRPPFTVRAALYMGQHSLLPDGWVNGFLYTYGTSLYRSAYLLGKHSSTGWWYYFPVAWGAKTPLAMIAAVGIGLVVALVRWRGLLWWSWIWMPVLAYGFLSVTTSMNIGLRHLAPIYPFIWIGIGVLAAFLLTKLGRPGLVTTTLLTWTLVLEVLPHWSHHIQFFNVATRGDALHLLSDSNLDWGQDVHELVRWQEKNPGIPLYAALFLPTWDVQRSGVRMTPYDSPRASAGVLAISATRLQGTYNPPNQRQQIKTWRDRTPDVILPGGTIFLYRVSGPAEAKTFP